jgi:hypothetical protein
MSDPSSGKGRSAAKKHSKKKNAKRKDALASEGVLANLPRTRPQRSSARREAARHAATTTPPRKPRAATKKRPAKAKVVPKRVQDPAPRQGFETEGDPSTGSVQPPGSLDLLSSAAELAGELTKSGLSTGGRLLKDAFARLPLN